MNGITLITPTCDRPWAFRLCERWMTRAIAFFREGPVQWIVVDDGKLPANCTMGQIHIRRDPSPTVAGSFRGNLLAATRQVEHEKILFIEDDDWYRADYLEAMSRSLSPGVGIVGEARSKYYNIATKRYHCCRNSDHASLCQTGIQKYLLPWLVEYLSSGSTTFIDVDLWRLAGSRVRRRLWPQSQRCIGIKGLPGKSGIGIGHRLQSTSPVDTDGTVLRSWIGKTDAQVYREMFDDDS